MRSFFLILITMSLCYPASFEDYHRVYQIPVVVNGESIKAIVDTGSTYCVFKHCEGNVLGHARVQLSNGKIETWPLYNLGVKIDNTIFSVEALQGKENIVGLNVLKMCKIDFMTKTVTPLAEIQ